MKNPEISDVMLRTFEETRKSFFKEYSQSSDEEGYRGEAKQRSRNRENHRFIPKLIGLVPTRSQRGPAGGLQR